MDTILAKKKELEAQIESAQAQLKAMDASIQEAAMQDFVKRLQQIHFYRVHLASKLDLKGNTIDHYFTTEQEAKAFSPNYHCVATFSDLDFQRVVKTGAVLHL